MPQPTEHLLQQPEGKAELARTLGHTTVSATLSLDANGAPVARPTGKLAYRGYHSAGLTLLNGAGVVRVRTAGRVAQRGAAHIRITDASGSPISVRWWSRTSPPTRSSSSATAAGCSPAKPLTPWPCCGADHAEAGHLENGGIAELTAEGLRIADVLVPDSASPHRKRALLP